MTYLRSDKPSFHELVIAGIAVRDGTKFTLISGDDPHQDDVWIIITASNSRVYAIKENYYRDLGFICRVSIFDMAIYFESKSPADSLTTADRDFITKCINHWYNHGDTLFRLPYDAPSINSDVG